MDPILWATGAIILSSLSLLGSSVVIYQIYRSQDSLSSSHEALVNAIFWMVFMDVFVSLWIVILYVPQYWGDVVYREDTWRAGFCVFLGFLIQVAISASCGWYFMIALMTVFLLRGTSTESIRRSVIYQHIFVWGISGSGAFVLLSFGALGIDVAMDNAPKVECWLSKNQSMNSLWLYIPIFVYMGFSVFLLVYAAFKVRTFRDPQRVSRRMIAFILMFLSVWVIPVVDRIRYVSFGEAPPPALAFVHWGVISLSGFANSVIWVSTTSSTVSRNVAHASSQSISSDESTAGLEEGSFEKVQWTLLQKGLMSPDMEGNNLPRDPSMPLPTGFSPSCERLANHMEAQKQNNNNNRSHHHPNNQNKRKWHQKLRDFRKHPKRKNNTEIPPTYATTNSLIVVEDRTADGEASTAVN